MLPSQKPRYEQIYAGLMEEIRLARLEGDTVRYFTIKQALNSRYLNFETMEDVFVRKKVNLWLTCA